MCIRDRPDLVCTLYRVDGEKNVALASGTRADGSTTIELEKLGEFAPNVEKDSTYKLGFYWKDTAGSNDALDVYKRQVWNSVPDFLWLWMGKAGTGGSIFLPQ